MPTFFSNSLTRLRKDAGFKTAYRFFHDNGGSQTLKLTYRKYLLMEQGKLLPNFGRLPTLMAALRILEGTPQAAELGVAWLRTMAGEEAFKAVLSPLLADRQGQGLPPMHKAMKKALSARKVHLSPGQVAAIHSGMDRYKCFLALTNDSRWWLPSDLAAAVGISAKDADAALRELQKIKVARKDKKGRYSSPLTAALVEFPTSQTLDKGLVNRIKACQNELIRKGEPVWLRRGIIRADAIELRGFFPVMALDLSTAHTYAITEKTRDSALFAIEGRIVKLLDF